jgi:hypothetical protein
MKVSDQLHAMTALPPGKEPWVPWIGGLVGPRAGLDMVAKRKIPNPCQEMNTDCLIYNLSHY